MKFKSNYRVRERSRSYKRLPQLLSVQRTSHTVYAFDFNNNIIGLVKIKQNRNFVRSCPTCNHDEQQLPRANVNSEKLSRLLHAFTVAPWKLDHTDGTAKYIIRYSVKN